MAAASTRGFLGSLKSIAKTPTLAGEVHSPMWLCAIAGYRISPVRLGHGLLGLHWEFLRLWTDFEQEIACLVFLCNGQRRNELVFVL